MQTKLPWLCAALLGVIGWLVGYFMNPGCGSTSAKPPTFPSEDSIAAPSGDRWTAAMAHDFEQSAAALVDDANELRQAHRLYELVKHLSAVQMPNALDAAMRLDPLKRAILIKRLLAHWAELDPSAAVHYAESLPKDPQYSEARSNAVGVWATRDFDAASKYIFASLSGKERREAFRSVATALAKKDPLAALKRCVESMPDATFSERADYQSMIVKEWVLKDFDAAAKIRARDPGPGSALLGNVQKLAESQMAKSPQDLLNWGDGHFRSLIARGYHLQHHSQMVPRCFQWVAGRSRGPAVK